MSRNILLDIPARLLGIPQAPDCPLSRSVEHIFRRGFALPAVAFSCTFAQERTAQNALSAGHGNRYKTIFCRTFMAATYIA